MIEKIFSDNVNVEIEIDVICVWGPITVNLQFRTEMGSTIDL